jgi:hypothetical protein
VEPLSGFQQVHPCHQGIVAWGQIKRYVDGPCIGHDLADVPERRRIAAIPGLTIVLRMGRTIRSGNMKKDGIVGRRRYPSLPV